MAEEKTINVTAGFPVCSILLLVFVLAKVFGIAPIAGWSWLWVLAPFWIPFAVAFAFFGFFLIAAIVAAVVAK